MSATRYVFVYDDGQVFSTDNEPTAADLEGAALGLATILRLTDATFYGRSGKWIPILRGQRGAAEVDGAAESEFHAPAGYFEQPARPQNPLTE